MNLRLSLVMVSESSTFYRVTADPAPNTSYEMF